MVNAITPTRTGSVEGRAIGVFDGLVGAPELASLVRALENGAFTKTEVARPETGQFKHWALNLPLEQAQQLPLHAPALAAARHVDGAHAYKAYRAYCNFAAYGDMLFTHTDAQPGSHELTALWFIALEWNPEWGGETLFFNSKMDAEFVVSPRPGRLVVFDGSIAHVGRPPNRICYAPRYTFAFKLERA
jgi:hypothetical protein